MQVIGNTSEDAGTEGIRAIATDYVIATVSGNTVLRSGGAGITGNGVYRLTGNRVMSAHGDGISFGWARYVNDNVVGRSTGRGIVLSEFGPWWNSMIRNNTSYLNGGPAFELTRSLYESDPDSVSNNIGYGSLYGLKWNGGGSPVLGCNDWFGNISGSTTGVSPGASDVSVNPLFCDLPLDSVYLSASSPLVNLPGCGLVGALGVGCVSAVSVDGPATLAGPMFAAIPSPSRGHVSFAIRGISTAASVEVFDLTGARRWRTTWQPGESGLQWDGRDAAGQAVAPGVYYARLTSGALIRSARVVLVR